MAKLPPHVRALERAVNEAGGYRPLGVAAKITHSTIRNMLIARPNMEPHYAISIEQALAKMPAEVAKIDRLEFFPELLRGPLGRRLIAAAQSDPVLYRDLIKAKLTV